MIAIIACILFFQYRDVQDIIHRARGWFGEISGMPSSVTDPRKQSASSSQITGGDDDRWDFLWSDEPSGTLGSYATEEPVTMEKPVTIEKPVATEKPVGHSN